MATEYASSVSTRYESLAKWASWLAALVGLWVLVSPFVLTGPIASRTTMWSNVVAGVLVAVLAAFGADELRTEVPAASTPSEWNGWLAAFVGVCILATPFVLTGSITSGDPMYTNAAEEALEAFTERYRQVS